MATHCDPKVGQIIAELVPGPDVKRSFSGPWDAAPKGVRAENQPWTSDNLRRSPRPTRIRWAGRCNISPFPGTCRWGNAAPPRFRAGWRRPDSDRRRWLKYLPGQPLRFD